VRRAGYTRQTPGVYPGAIAQHSPDLAALIMGATGDVITYRELDERSNRLA
jgi:long-chain acyl-CoA synthetase